MRTLAALQRESMMLTRLLIHGNARALGKHELCRSGKAGSESGRVIRTSLSLVSVGTEKMKLSRVRMSLSQRARRLVVRY